ncbi:MAG: DUF2231 domain-containing protein [Brevundimonas sp.]|uniref:DUF2231 domain-containing protein n=2 Tax=Alphaproteobacteria TaxID=28211 RepID=UPI0040347504
MDLRTGASAGVNAVHGILLAFSIALFSSAMVSDIAYLRTAEMQWTNFSAWLIAGALLFGGVVLAWSLVRLVLAFRSPSRKRRLVYSAVLAIMWVLGLLNALKHSQDAWSSVGTFGMGLSVICTLLALTAGALAFSGFVTEEVAR